MIQSACQVTFLGMDALEAAKVEVLAWLPRLGALTDQATGAKVLIEAVDEHRKQRLYRVRMDLAMKEGVVVVGHDHPSNVAHEDVYVAIRNAFRAARRQLEDYFKTRGVSQEINGASRVVVSEVNAAEPRGGHAHDAEAVSGLSPAAAPGPALESVPATVLMSVEDPAGDGLTDRVPAGAVAESASGVNFNI